MADLKDDLPTAMITAAFAGISWYIGIELNVRLFLAGVRQRGLYFWSVLVGSWGVLSQPLVIQLVNFDVWKTSPGSVAAIYLSWSILVVPQSFVLYSRLHLFLDPPKLRWIFYLIAFVSFTFAIPTIIIGTVGQTVLSSRLAKPNLSWDKVQLTVFFAQETFLSLLYIRETRIHLKRIAPLQHDARKHRQVLTHLIWINILIICLDISLIGVCFSNLFYVQGHYKPLVYAIKLRMEFTILNELRKTLQASQHSSGSNWESPAPPRRSQANSGGDIELIPDARRQDDSEFLYSKLSSQATVSIPAPSRPARHR